MKLYGNRERSDEFLELHRRSKSLAPHPMPTMAPAPLPPTAYSQPGGKKEVRTAYQLRSPNREDDDLAVRIAIVGFSHSSPTEEWAIEHFDFLRRRIASEYTPADLFAYGPKGENIRLFFSLCCGYLLGLYQAGRISDQEFALAEVQIPGLMALYAGQLIDADVS